jgi:hypothetical protein
MVSVLTKGRVAVKVTEAVVASDKLYSTRTVRSTKQWERVITRG